MNLSNTGKLKIAIPSKGRLKESSVEIFEKAGYKFRVAGRNLYATCTNSDIVFIFVRADDIPVLVDKGVVDLGITGSDLIIEREANVQELLSLGFGKCRLCVAVPENYNSDNLSNFEGQNIATSFPVMAEQYFKSHGVNINCIEMNGSVEIMVDLGLAKGIVDLVETGDSLRDNNLKVFSDIGKYEATLIANSSVVDKDEVKNIKRRIEGILVARQYSMLEYNINRNNLITAEKVTPGFESPTISKLDQENWVAVKVMVKKSEIISTMEKLEKLGATAMLESEILNCRL